MPQSSKTAARLVVKVGSSTLTDQAGRIDRAFIADLAADLAAQRAAGAEVLLVTSGAIRAGREHLAGAGAAYAQQRETLPYKQAAAAVGQGLLMHTYTEAFAWRNVSVAQVLLTREDLADRRRFLNARNTLRALSALGVVPIVNENDTVAVDEIRFGDNDTLAALTAVVAEADLLLILSDVEGLYPEPPSPDSALSTLDSRLSTPASALMTHDSRLTTPIPVVACIDEHIAAIAGDSTSGAGTGGMRTKVEAARIATSSGIRTVVARGRRPGVIADVVAERPVGTTFLPGSGRLRGRKRWIAAGSRPRGAVTVNRGASERLRAESVSLLAVGITDVTGDFGVGDLVEVRDESGRRFARGLTNYSAADIRLLQGLRSDQFEAALGHKTQDEVIHRDNLVVEA